MIFFVILAVALWCIGALAGVPYRVRYAMIGMLYLGFLAALLILPADHGLRTRIGGDIREWLVAGVATLLVWAYARWLAALKARRQAPPATSPTAKSGTFSETELKRYARHIVLRELGGAGQKKLKSAQVLVVGAGGLGSPALLYLAAAGVGTIGIVDDDEVGDSNLQRQVIHRDRDVGTPKVFSAERAMKARNPAVNVRPHHRRLTEEIAADLIGDYDIVLDGSDNFDTRYLVNRVCSEAEVPLVSGALSQWEGQISVFDPARGAPCYRCVFPKAPAPDLVPSCAEAGVLGPLPGAIGAMMAIEAVKVVTGTGTPMRGRMLIYDALQGETRQFTVRPRPDCTVCGKTGRGKVRNPSQSISS